MSLLTLMHAHLAFGHVPLLDDASLSLQPQERVGLIGRNGTGKSSLLKILAGLEKADDGTLSVQQGLRVAYVPQEPLLDDALTIEEAVREGLAPAQALIDAWARGEGDLHVLQGQIEALDGWRIDQRVAETLERLRLAPQDRVGALSGGQRKRVALARALVTRPDVLLLDEPTNHLDLDSIRWLENLLIQFSGSVVTITHDRAFLDRVATRIVELDRGQLRSYPGNFAQYLVLKEEQLAQEGVIAAKADRLLAQEEVWVRKGVEARRTRSQSRITRLQALRQARAQRREQVGRVRLDIDAGLPSGKLVAELVDVSKSFVQADGSRRVVVQGFGGTIMRGDKIGLLGPNGAGKTTLLKLILGELEADSGSIKRGSKLEVAYFDQFRTQLDEETSVADIISQGNDFVDICGQKKHVMSYLEDFLFSPQRARSPVRSLSGGERNRLLLARLFTRPANVLVLDEPTNDLDIDTLELLEELIEQYTGTVFVVSHDRAFLDNVVTQVIAFEGEGRLEEYPGGYQDWVDTKARMAAMKQEAPARKDNYAANPDAKPERDRSARTQKLSFNEKRELERLPQEIADLENEQAQLNEKLLDPNAYRSAPLEARGWQARIEEIDLLLLEKLERWEALEAKQA